MNRDGMADADLFAGVDVGGTNIVCGLTDAAGRLLGTVKRPTEGERGGDALVARIAGMIGELLKDNRLDPGRLKAAGVGIPGFLEPDKGIVHFAANLNLTDFPIVAKLEEKLGVPVCADNDVRMYMYGEAMRGAAAGYAHVLGVAIGTGMAGAFITHGQLHYGSGFLAGEIGHATVEGNAYVCGCGMTGCIETLVSAGGIVRQARDRMRTRKSVLHDWFPEAGADAHAACAPDPEAGADAPAAHAPGPAGNPAGAPGRKPMTAADVARAYDLGDPVATEVFACTGRVLGAALSVPVILTSPDIVVIGGGVSLAGERLLAPLRKALRERIHPLYGERVIVAQAQLTDHAGVIGSALSARRRSEQPR